jgi:hypothetical protein
MNLRGRTAGLSKNQQAIAGLVKIIAFGVIAGVVVYCDIQFIQVMWKTYPDGVGKIFSLIGAVATGASMLALIIAEAYWFSRGPQMLAGWLFTAVEASVSASNVILGFELTGGVSHLDPFMASYLWFCPATPVVAAFCWIIVFALDESQKARHDEREMQDDMAASDRKHAMAVHASKMMLKGRYLDSTTTYLEQIAEDPQVQAGLRLGAWKFAGEQLRELTGMYLPLPSQPNPIAQGSIVDSRPQQTPTKTAEQNEDPKTPEPDAHPAPANDRDDEQPIPQARVQEPPVARYPFLSSAPRYDADTEPLTPIVAQSTYIDDLADSVGGATASPLETQAPRGPSLNGK